MIFCVMAMFPHAAWQFIATQQAIARKLQKQREEELENGSLEAYAELERVREQVQNIE